MVPGHEWTGEIVMVGCGVTGLNVGDKVTGDTFIGCGHCTDCRAGRHYICADHVEIGVLGDAPGALADYLAVSARAVTVLPAGLEESGGALVEPASCALRAVRKTAVRRTDRVLIWGCGTLGTFAGLFARDAGAAVSIVVRSATEQSFVAELGLRAVFAGDVISGEQDVVIEATGADAVIQRVTTDVCPGGRVGLIGLNGSGSAVPISDVVLRDLSVFGVLGGSAVFEEAASALARFGPSTLSRLVDRTISLESVPSALRRSLRLDGAVAPKIQVRL